MKSLPFKDFRYWNMQIAINSVLKVLTEYENYRKFWLNMLLEILYMNLYICIYI